MEKIPHDKISLEQYLSSLEKIVAQLESGELPLEESLKKFEEGIGLYKNCKAILGDVEKRIKVLTDGLKEEDLDEKENP